MAVAFLTLKCSRAASVAGEEWMIVIAYSLVAIVKNLAEKGSVGGEGIRVKISQRPLLLCAAK